MLLLVTNNKLQQREDEKKVPKFFKDIDDCAIYCVSHCNNPIKVAKALLVWSKQQKDKDQQDKALLKCAELACNKAVELEDDQALVLIPRVLTILSQSRKLIDKDQRYIWH
jgi:hypothetical protein